MIAKLEGQIIYKNEKFVIIDVNNVGYKVYIRSDNISIYNLKETTTLWIYTAVRENSIDLYGFKTMEELSFFELLLNVSGIGPKSALSILNLAPIDILKRAIATGDTTYLNKVSGIGKKTAEKIIIELRDKLKNYKDNSTITSSLRDENDILEALKSLGYNQNEARNALSQVADTTIGTNKRIKEVLQILGGGC